MDPSLQIQVAEAARSRDSMTGRDRLEAALARRPVDRVPISFKRIDPFDTANPRLRSDSNYRLLTEIAGRYTDVLHDWRFDLNAPVYGRSSDARVERRRSPDGLETHTTVTTRAGTLTLVEQGLRGSTWTVKPLIETEDDLDIFLAHSWEPLRPEVDGYWQEAERLADRGLMRISLLDPLGMAAMLLERESFYTWVLTRPDLLDRLVDQMFERMLALVSHLAASGVRCPFQFSGAEYLAPPMASPTQFDRHVTRYGKPVTDVLRKHGCAPYIHCHSRVGQILDRFWRMGHVATHPVEPPPMGDVTPAEFKQRAAERLTMIGNIQIGELMTGDPATIHSSLRDLIESMGTGGGLIVSDSANPWETPMTDRTLRNYIALIEAAYTYGQAG